MEIIATVTAVTDKSGMSSTGNAYSKTLVVVTYGDQYPKNLALYLIGKRSEEYAPRLKPGQRLRFFIDAASREYNGNWYTDLTVWKMESPAAAMQQQPMPQPTPPPTYAQAAPSIQQQPQDDYAELPF